jgi:hypothetical protein
VNASGSDSGGETRPQDLFVPQRRALAEADPATLADPEATTLAEPIKGHAARQLCLDRVALTCTRPIRSRGSASPTVAPDYDRVSHPPPPT